MNNKIEEDEIFTNEEPQISYYSSSLNCGVTAIFSKKEIKSYKKTSKLFGPVSPKNNFSLCNTIMLPFIINKELIESDNNKKINHSASLIKENDMDQNSLKIDNTRNKTFSSKGENKKNNDSLNGKINVEKENINIEINPLFLEKNFSANYMSDNKNENFNLRYVKEKIYDSENNNCRNDSRNEEEIKGFMSKEQCKSVNINDVSMKNSILKDENKKDKGVLIHKKSKKARIKENILNKKSKNKENFKGKFVKKKSFFCHPQSRSFLEEIKKECPKKVLENENGRRTNHSGGNTKNKTYYYSNKIINQNYNKNYFKSIIKKKDKSNEKEHKIEDHKVLGKTERKKKKKNGNKTPLREININTKSIKFKFPKALNLKFNDSSYKRQGLNILKEHINNKKEESSESSISLTNVKLKNNKITKLKIRNILLKKKEKDNKDSDTKKKKKIIKTKTPNRRTSGFSFKKKINRRNSDNENSESKTFKTIKPIKLKNLKDKDNISKSQYSLLDTNKNKLNNSISKKEIDSLKNSLDEKEKINKITNIIRRKRSISMHIEISKLQQVEGATKQKSPLYDSNLNSLSTTNANKIKKINKKRFDFESALKKNTKKMQFNLFSKDKFTNTEFSGSDYLKYTLNCMELILDIDIEKQTRLKNKINFNFPKPKKKGIKKRIALFDLDETLVHCTGDIRIKKDKHQHEIEINLPGKQAVKVGINLRPYWKQTLNLIKKNYFIVVYTASHQAYADAVLDFMDPKKKYFKYRLYRNSCSLLDVEGAKFYVKDLDIFNEHYDLKDIVIIDNSVLSFAYHLHNGIPIVPYYDEDKDGSLYVVGLYLIHICEENDLREANKTQINLDSFLEEAKKQREENENIIDEESGDVEEEEKSPNPEQKAKVTKIMDEKNNNIEANKISMKNNTLSRKKSFIPNTLVNPRRQSHDLTQKKLISQSKLINMYFEVNDESSKTIQNKINESIEEKKCSNNNNTNNIIQDRNQKDKTAVMITEEEEELDCKSEPGFLINQNNSNNISDNDSSDEEVAILKRGYTIIDEERKDNSKIKGKLKYIRSNFFNKFKIK